MTPDPVTGRTLAAALRAVRAARRRVAALARSSPDADPWALVARCRAELLKLEPELARHLTAATLAGWVLAARRPAIDAIPLASDIPPVTPDPYQDDPPQPPQGGRVAPAADDAGQPVRFPLVEAGVRDLLHRQVVTLPEYDTLTAQAKAAAFTVARVVTADAVTAVRDAVAETVADGMTLNQFRRRVAPAVGGSLSESQVEAVFRTQVGQAAAAGLRAALEQPAVAAEFPYLLYSATLDARTRPTHAFLGKYGLDGTGVYRADDPVIRRFMPPWAWNCRCVCVPLTIEDAAARGVREARKWLATGREPSPPAFVSPVPFDLPRGWHEPTAIRAVVA